jgi:hypothetical protein
MSTAWPTAASKRWCKAKASGREFGVKLGEEGTFNGTSPTPPSDLMKKDVSRVWRGLLGHRDFSTTQRDMHLDDRDLAEV